MSGSAGVLLLGRGIGAVLSVAGLMILTRALSVEEFGYYAYVMTLVNLGAVLIGLGGNPVATAQMARDPASRERVLASLLSLRGITGVAVFLLFSAWVSTTEDGGRRLAFLLGAPLLLVVGLNGVEARFQVEQRMHVPVSCRLSGQLTFVLACSLLYWNLGSLSLAWVVLLSASTTAAAALLSYFLSRPLWNPRREFSARAAFGFFARSYPQGLATVFGLLYFHLDTVLLRFLQGPAETAIYGAGYRLFAFAVSVPGLVLSPLLPEMARSVGHLSRWHHKAFGIVLPVAASGAVLMAVLAPEVVDVLYPEERYLDTIPVVRVLFLAFAFVWLGSLGGLGLVALGSQRTWAVITGVGFLANLGGNLVAIPRWGALGAASVTLGTEALVALAALWVVTRATGTLPGWRSVGAAVGAAGLTWVSASAVRGYGPVAWGGTVLVLGALGLYLSRKHVGGGGR